MVVVLLAALRGFSEGAISQVAVFIGIGVGFYLGTAIAPSLSHDFTPVTGAPPSPSSSFFVFTLVGITIGGIVGSDHQSIRQRTDARPHRPHRWRRGGSRRRSRACVGCSRDSWPERRGPRSTAPSKTRRFFPRLITSCPRSPPSSRECRRSFKRRGFPRSSPTLIAPHVALSGQSNYASSGHPLDLRAERHRQGTRERLLQFAERGNRLLRHGQRSSDQRPRRRRPSSISRERISSHRHALRREPRHRGPARHGARHSAQLPLSQNPRPIPRFRSSVFL